MTGFAGATRPLQPQDPREVSGYPLRGRIGSGGMGTVYLSETRGRRPVALKVVNAQLAEDPLFRRRFEQEVGAAQRVRGRYLVPVLDSDTDGPLPWVATAYVPGPSLAAAVAAHGPLPPDAAVRLTAGIAQALDAVHSAGVVHRDLKPGNVMLAADGPAVIDFGIARAADATSLTGTDIRVGTPAFMAPEQIEGGAPPTPAVDVFALGLTVHIAATGTHPFGEGAATALLYRIVNGRPDLSACPPPLRELIGRCLAREPEARPTPQGIVAACRELGAALELGDPMPTTGWLPATHTTVTAPHAPAPDASPYTATNVAGAARGPAPGAWGPGGTSPDAKAPPRPPHVPPQVMSAPSASPLTPYPGGAGAWTAARPATAEPGGGTTKAAATLALLTVPGMLFVLYIAIEFLRNSLGPPDVIQANMALGAAVTAVLVWGAVLLRRGSEAGRRTVAVAAGLAALQALSFGAQFFLTGGDLDYEIRGSLPSYAVIVFVVSPLTALPALAATVLALLPATRRWCRAPVSPG